MVRVCKECGKEFETKSSARKFCYDTHFRACAWCGKQIAITDISKLSSERSYCSKECSNKAKGSAYLSMKPVHECTCVACGEKFMSEHANSKICSKVHMLTCKYCGKEFVANSQQLLGNTQTCSKECRYKLSVKSYHDHWDDADSKEALQRKQQSTMQARYGISNALCKDSPFREKGVQTMTNKYGTVFTKSKYFKPSIEATSLKKYGVKYYMQTEEFKKKYRETCLKRYGVDNYAKSAEFLKSAIISPEKYVDCFEFKSNPEQFIQKHFSNKPTLRELSESCGMVDSSVGYIIDQLGLTDLVQYTFSRMEDEVYEFIHELVPNTTIIRNTFKVITPYELDLYLPEFNFAIECNPTITHNSSIPGFGSDDKPKPSSYHKMKTDLCENQNIFLFHIFGYDWTNRKDIIKSMISNILNCTKHRLYARNCEVRSVSFQDSKRFLELNHRQGASASSYRYGLYHDSELVSLMTFSLMRPTIGKSKDTTKSCFELVRFCNKLNTSVTGGASKLLAHFIKDHDPQEIRSFSDRAHTQGKLYELLGFKYDHTTSPGYMWVSMKSDAAFARNNAQKSNIIKFLRDDSIDLNDTEAQIMISHNFVQVFDSGVNLWIWRKDNVQYTG